MARSRRRRRLRRRKGSKKALDGNVAPLPIEVYLSRDPIASEQGIRGGGRDVASHAQTPAGIRFKIAGASRCQQQSICSHGWDLRDSWTALATSLSLLATTAAAANRGISLFISYTHTPYTFTENVSVRVCVSVCVRVNAYVSDNVP